MKYNLGKFNLTTNVISIRGQGVMALDARIQIEVERRASAQTALAVNTSVVYGIECRGEGQAAMALNAGVKNYEVERSGESHIALILTTGLDWTREQPGSGATTMAMDAALQRYEVERRAEGRVPMALSSNRTDWVVEKYGAATIGMAIGSFGDPTRLKYAPGAPLLPMNLQTSGITNLLGVDYIHLVMDLQPGEELELDMCELTAMLDGANAMKYLASDGNFFDFPAGLNELIFSLTPATVPVESEIYYKDKWL